MTSRQQLARSLEKTRMDLEGLDLITRPPTGVRWFDYVLIFDTMLGNPKVHYMMINPLHPTKFFPIVNTMNMERLRNLVDYRVAVHHGYLYIIGGKDWSSNEYLTTMSRYNPTTCNWVAVAKMSTRRARFTVNILGGCIYVTGGEVKHGKVTNSVEAYDPVANKWTEKRPLPKPRADHASCVFNRDTLFVSGGFGNVTKQMSDVFWQYNTKTDQWSDVLPHLWGLPCPKERHLMASYRDQLFIFSGVTTKGKSKEESMDDPVPHVFNINHRREHKRPWTKEVPVMFNVRSRAGMFVIGHRAYLVGGRNNKWGKPVPMIDCLHMRKKRWYETLSLGLDNLMSAQCVVLRVPESNYEFSHLGIAMYDKWVLW
ncbi:kelch-like protein 10 [Lineus longissimus]|uniref:kelch-like protein 10 n=1 Tax=Lineus longissimus TaxID=88925 RepID=UPI00315D9E72